MKNLQQKEVVDSTKITAEECQQVRIRWKFICCELKALEFRWSFFMQLHLNKNLMVFTETLKIYKFADLMEPK